MKLLHVIILGIVMTAAGEGLQTPGAVRTDSVRIEVLYTQQGNLYFYALETPNYQSQFVLRYFEYTKRPKNGEARTQFLAYTLPGSTGRQLTTAFEGLELSWSSDAFYWSNVPVRFAELPESHVPCGVVATLAQQVLACPISSWASAKKSADANNLAWFIQTLELTRHRFTGKSAGAERNSDDLLRLLQRVDLAQEVSVSRMATETDRRVPVGLMLRTAIAEGLVHGGLVEKPMNRPEVEIRKAAVGWYADRLSEKDARQILLRALGDSDSRVRAAAATVLASDVARNDDATIEALRGVLQREPDSLVRQIIQDLLDGREIPPRSKKRDGS